MNILKELNYLFDRKLKWKALVVLIIIMIGSVAELAGVSAILPVISLATDSEAMKSNRFCIMVGNILGTEDSRKVLLALIVMIIVIYVMKNMYLAWMTHQMNCFSKNTMKYFSTRLLSSYMKQPYVYFLHKNTAEILRSINSDTVNLYATISNTMQVVSQGLTASLLIIYSLVENPIMTLLVAGLLGSCALIITFGIQKKMRRMGREHQKVSAYIIQYAKQSFEGIKEVKIMNREQYFISQYEEVYEQSSELERKCNLLSNLPKYLIETVCIAGVMLYLAIAIIAGAEMSLLVPQLAVFSVAAFKLLPSMNALYTNFSNILYHKASVDAIYHDIKEVENENIDFAEIEDMGKIQSFEQKICLDNITFSYEGRDTAVLKDVFVEIRKGTSIAFVGESGGGKTTLVDIMLGLLEPQKGRVVVDGLDIREDLRGWHNRIGYIPQMIFLLDDTICKNVAFGVSEEHISEKRIWAVLKEAKLDDFVRQLPEGLETMVGEAGARLSGGQRQRIGIARALYSNPDILVFDEATSALDSETEKEVMEAIDGLHGSKTMVMIAHRITTIENCDKVYSVGGGTVTCVR